MITDHIGQPRYTTAMLWIAALPVLYFISRYNYNLFHSLADGISIAIAVSVFMIVWNARRIVDNDYLLYVGISFLFFALIDLLHVPGNKNMGVFSQYGNLGPALYIASRYFISISLLIAPLFIKRKLNSALTFAVYSLATALVLLSIFHWKIFPACIVEGVGLTPFKVISDYIICLILLGAVGFLLANKGSFDSKVFWVVVSSIILSIATGVAFTLYADPFGIANAVGHFFQIGSFYLIYMAIVETSVTKPQEILYRKLKQSEEELARNVKRLDYANVGLMQEINERKKAEAVLEETRFTLSEGQRIAHVGSFEYVAETRTTVWSDEECRIYGLAPGTPSPAYDIMLSKFIYPDDAALLHETFTKAMQSGSVYELEHRIVRPDGSVRVVHDRAHPYFDAKGRLVRYVGATLDITDRKEAEEALQKAHDKLQDHARRLEETNRELEDFAYTISHDLRAPLRVINGFAHMFADDYGHSIDEEGKRRLGVIESNAVKMGILIDDLLAFSRAGRTVMSLTRIDMKRLVAQVLEMLKTSETGTRSDIQVTRLPDAFGDPSLIRQVLVNLLENAMKFSSKRPDPRIEVGGFERDGERVYFVKDNGVGFDMKYSSKLFGVFQRLVTEREFDGTGVGLAIVHRLVARHGGRVWAESKLGEGATFYFTLPRKGDLSQ